MNTYAASLLLIAAMIGVGVWLEHTGPPKSGIGDWIFSAVPMGIIGILIAIYQHMV